MNEQAKKLLSSANSVLEKCSFDRTDKDQVALYREGYGLLLQAADADLTSDKALLRLCSISTQYNKKPHPEIIDFALRALSREVSYDAVAYLCKSYNFNLESAECREKILSLQGQLDDVDLRNFCGVYIGITHYREGRFVEYCDSVEKFNRNKSSSFSGYLAIPIATVGTSRSPIVAMPSIEGNTAFNILSSNKSPRIIISVSCDVKYFLKYKDLFLSSFEKTQPKTSLCHLSIVGRSIEECSSLIENCEIIQANIDQFMVSAWGVGETVNVGPIAASTRMMHMFELISACSCPVICLDFDSVLLRPLEELVLSFSESDSLFRILPNVAPWEQITGGFCAILPTEKGKLFAQHINNFLSDKLGLSTSQWWIDQNALEYAFRSMIEDGAPLRYSNIVSIRDKFVRQPTGSDGLKLSILNKAFDEIA